MSNVIHWLFSTSTVISEDHHFGNKPLVLRMYSTWGIAFMKRFVGNSWIPEQNNRTVDDAREYGLIAAKEHKSVAACVRN